MLNPRHAPYSLITRALRRDDGVEIVRWYSAPHWGNTLRVYRNLTPASIQRLQIIFTGLRARTS